MNNITRPMLYHAGAPSHENEPRPIAKWVRVLSALATRQHLTRFQAERDPAVADHCLPSTVAELQRRHGLRIDRRIIRVPGHGGAPAFIAEYHLDDEARAEALAVLAAARGR